MKTFKVWKMLFFVVFFSLLLTFSFTAFATNQSSRSSSFSRPQTEQTDAYGYTWDDSETFTWVSATLTTTIQGEEDYDSFELGFPFYYYGQIYTQTRVTSTGILIFDDGYLIGCCGRIEIPSTRRPNHVIAPFSAQLIVGGTYNDGFVNIERGGNAPDRFFIAEWHEVEQAEDENNLPLTFQVILHENGDIVFQYKRVPLESGQYTIGIEDHLGIDGLTYPFQVQDQMAIRFTHPEPLRRLRAYPFDQGAFAQRHKTTDFSFFIENNGSLGQDVYNLEILSDWEIGLFRMDDRTALMDTNGDSILDTGPINQGEALEILVQIRTPDSAMIGDQNRTLITATSNSEPYPSRQIQLSTALPAPFAQLYGDSIYLVHPELPRSVAANGGSQAFSGPERLILSSSSGGIYYKLLDGNGNLIQDTTPVRLHGWHQSSFNSIAAVAPDGTSTVVLGYGAHIPYCGGFCLYLALHYAMIGPDGSYGGWEDGQDYGSITSSSYGGEISENTAPYFYTPDIAATKNNHFVYTWEREYWEDVCIGDCWVTDVLFSIIDTSNNLIRLPTNLTNDDPSVPTNYASPSVAALNQDQAIIAFACGKNLTLDTLCYTVIESFGDIVRPTEWLQIPNRNILAIDHVQTENGNIIFAWEQSGEGYYEMAYAALNANFEWITHPTVLQQTELFGHHRMDYVSFTSTQTTRQKSLAGLPSAIWDVSVTGSGDHSVITWTSASGKAVMYALIDANGQVLTGPMPFLGNNLTTEVSTHAFGFGNSFFELTPTEWAFPFIK